MFQNITEINKKYITITHLGNSKYLKIKYKLLNNSPVKYYFLTEDILTKKNLNADFQNLQTYKV